MCQTQPTVSFQTILDVRCETPKSVKIYGQAFLPKSQVSYVVTGTTTREETVRGKKIAVEVQIVNITMPKWLNDRA